MKPNPSRDVTPGTYELYVLVVGLLLGILIGPAVLGRIAPEAYDQWVTSRAGPRPVSLADFEEQTYQSVKNLKSSGVTDAAILEYQQSRASERQKVMADDRLEQVRAQMRSLSRSVALVMAVVAVMVIETAVSARWRGVRRRLMTARYVLIAFWMAFTIAQPVSLSGFPMIFFGGLVLIVGASVLLTSAVEAKLIQEREAADE